MGGYPHRWEADAVLADGGTVHIRPIRPDDTERLRALFHRLSAETVYLRFFTPVSEPTAAQLSHLCTVDHSDRVALVATLGDEIVAVARYDRLRGTDEAEVAFTVQDDQQGRGLGTLLLEHLAAVAREQGIRRFVAEVLPGNRRMLGVFADAGYQVRTDLAGGVVHVRLELEPTEAARARIEAREHVAEARSVQRLLAPGSVAVIGAGRRPGSIGHEVMRNLLAGGFTGPVYPVHPTARSVAGVRAYPRIEDVPDHVDLAVIAVPAPAVPDVARSCARAGVHGVVVLSAGFAEAGETGREADLVAACRSGGMRLVGPNCMGVVNTDPEVRLHATFSPSIPPRGRVGFASQSGALGIELLAQAARHGLGVSTFVSLGNKADLSGNDLLQFWEADDATDVILLYLESFGNPRKFARLARRVSRTKPIVALKAGRSEAGSRAAASHTAALAAADAAVDALFRQAGVLRVGTAGELFETARVLARRVLPRGPRVAIVSNGGGPAILAADAAAAAGLEVPPLGPSTRRRVAESSPPGAAVANPVDLTAAAGADHYRRVLTCLVTESEVDSVIVVFVPPLGTEVAEVAAAITEVSAAQPDRLVVACFLTRDLPDAEAGPAGPSGGAPPCGGRGAAAGAVGRATASAAWRGRDPGRELTYDDLDLEAAHRIAHAALDHAGGAPTWLSPDDAVRLLESVGVPCAPVRVVGSADEAVAAAGELGWPVALKAVGPTLVHRTEHRGVVTDLTDPEALRVAYAELRTRLGETMEAAVVQPMVAGGVETIVGVTQDPTFGPLVAFGLGGVTAELWRDVAVRLVPLTDADVAELLAAPRGAPLLHGWRGAPPVDLQALGAVLGRVGVLADALAELAELDCNPLVARRDGVWVLDAKVRVRPPPPRPPAGVRRLGP
jgi:acetyl coenzyme A synthetase (ADP forming)-like protein